MTSELSRGADDTREVTSSDEIADELADVVYRLDAIALPTAQKTRHITQEIARWAVERGWRVRREAGMRLCTGGLERRGFYDLVIDAGGASAPIAVEIDTTDKAWSLEKLRHAAASGMCAIWIRWGDEGWAEVDDEVYVIQLPPSRRPQDVSRRTEQMPIWR
jgi:hypothetical protein